MKLRFRRAFSMYAKRDLASGLTTAYSRGKELSVRWRSSRYRRDPDECHEDMGWTHQQAFEHESICTDCGLDFRFKPPLANMRSDDEGDMKPVSGFRFYGVDRDGWLVGNVTDEFDITRWVDQNNIDTSKPHGPRPVPPSIEATYKHGPFYVEQAVVDKFRRRPR